MVNIVNIVEEGCVHCNFSPHNHDIMLDYGCASLTAILKDFFVIVPGIAKHLTENLHNPSFLCSTLLELQHQAFMIPAILCNITINCSM